MLRAALTLALLIAVGVFLAPPSAVAAEEEKDEPKFVGVGKCLTCHKGEKNGKQFELWMERGHFRAYDTLATDKAKAVAKERGVEGDPQKSDDCLACHSLKLGLAKDKADKKAKFSYKIKNEDTGKKETVDSLGVECESCHGPGSIYKKKRTMLEHEAAVAAGLWDANERCVSCHDEQNDPEFNFEEKMKKILHAVPEKTKEANKEKLAELKAKEAAGE